MRTLAALLAVVAFAAAACRSDEPVAPVSTCGPAWRASIDLADTWSDLGGSSADDGRHVLVAWQARPRIAEDDGVVMMAMFDSDTGDVAMDAVPLLAPQEIWGIQVVATARGFLVFTFLGSAGVQVQHVGTDGSVTNGVRLAVDAADPDDRVVADADGATLVSFGLQVTRVDADGNLVSTSTLAHVADFCTGVAATGPDRLLAWCIAFDAAGQWDKALLISMARDGSDATVTALDDRFPVKLARLAASGDRVLATFEDGSQVLAAAFDFDGNVVAAPASIGRAEKGAQLLGEQVCTGTCDGLSITASADGAIVGFELLVDTFDTNNNHVQFTRLAMSSGGAVVATKGREQTAHAHTAAATSTGPLVTWLDNSAFHLLPWDMPRQRLVVDRSCGLH